jgi:hypothetical protein
MLKRRRRRPLGLCRRALRWRGRSGRRRWRRQDLDEIAHRQRRRRCFHGGDLLECRLRRTGAGGGWAAGRRQLPAVAQVSVRSLRGWPGGWGLARRLRCRLPGLGGRLCDLCRRLRRFGLRLGDLGGRFRRFGRRLGDRRGQLRWRDRRFGPVAPAAGREGSRDARDGCGVGSGGGLTASCTGGGVSCGGFGSSIVISMASSSTLSRCNGETHHTPSAANTCNATARKAARSDMWLERT